jgi:hypothetical protein
LLHCMFCRQGAWCCQKIWLQDRKVIFQLRRLNHKHSGRDVVYLCIRKLWADYPHTYQSWDCRGNSTTTLQGLGVNDRRICILSFRLKQWEDSAAMMLASTPGSIQTWIIWEVSWYALLVKNQLFFSIVLSGCSPSWRCQGNFQNLEDPGQAVNWAFRILEVSFFKFYAQKDKEAR